VTIAADAAPEIDRLVLSVDRSASEQYGTELLAAAAEIGLDSLDLLPHLSPFLLAGCMTRDLAALRLRYFPTQRVQGRLDELEEKGLIVHEVSGMAATLPLRGLLGALLDAKAATAAEMWGAHVDDVAAAGRWARVIADAATDDHVVAAIHRTLPEPTDPFLLLHQRLVTLRLVRHHDHAEAWLGHGLTARAIVVMTALWRGGRNELPIDGLARLIELGYAVADPPSLTSAGSAVRESIEADTNRRAEATFAVLDDSEAAGFLGAIRTLPGDN
jgi:hypothetical protein